MNSSWLFFAIVFMACILVVSGCTDTQAEKTDIVTEDASSMVNLSGADEVQVEETSSGLVVVNPEALQMEMRFKYNADKGISYTSNGDSSKNNIAVWITGSQQTNDYYFSKTSSGSSKADLKMVVPDSGNIFLFVTVRTSALKGTPLSPTTWAFQLIDQDDNIYSPKLVLCEDYLGKTIALKEDENESAVYDYNLDIAKSYKFADMPQIYVQREMIYDNYKDNDVRNLQGTLLFEVPEDFDRDRSYVAMDVGNLHSLWSLIPVNCWVDVRKDIPTGNIIATFQGGSNINTIKDITIRVFCKDGSVNEGTLEPVINSEITVPGTRGADERVQIIFNHYSGKRYLVYDEIVKNR